MSGEASDSGVDAEVAKPRAPLAGMIGCRPGSLKVNGYLIQVNQMIDGRSLLVACLTLSYGELCLQPRLRTTP